jgi:hypothetical protein
MMSLIEQRLSALFILVVDEPQSKSWCALSASAVERRLINTRVSSSPSA